MKQIKIRSTTIGADRLTLLADPARLAAMSEAGRARLGKSGSLDAVIHFAAHDLGWVAKCALHQRLARDL